MQLIGTAVAGPMGMLPGALIGSLVGVGLNISYAESTGTLYAGPTVTVTPSPMMGGNGAGITFYRAELGQDVNASMIGWGLSVNYQPLFWAGSGTSFSPGQDALQGRHLEPRVLLR